MICGACTHLYNFVCLQSKPFSLLGTVQPILLFLHLCHQCHLFRKDCIHKWYQHTTFVMAVSAKSQPLPFPNEGGTGKLGKEWIKYIVFYWYAIGSDVFSVMLVEPPVFRFPNVFTNHVAIVFIRLSINPVLQIRHSMPVLVLAWYTGSQLTCTANTNAKSVTSSVTSGNFSFLIHQANFSSLQ